jgi:hypothetical protein
VNAQRLRELFPSLAEWPAEKWMLLPIALLLVIGCIIGVGDAILGRI